MADNLVSKFTVNSQGTDIDVKIKDEDARNLIAQEISDRDSAVTTITNNLNKEISDRKSADTALDERITQETTAREQETTARENADTALDERITQETTARENADTALDERITQETTARENADTEINNNINAINRQIKNLHGKFTNTKVVTIGDSYGRGFYSNSEHISEGWPAQLKSITGLNIIDYSYGGAGFVGNSTGTGHQFLDQLQTAVRDGNNDAELLIISGGSNDCNATGLIGAINQALNYAVNNFINAKIMVIWNSVNYIYTLEQKNSTIMTYNEGCMNNNVPFYNVSPYVRFVYNTVAEDKLHLNAKGYKIIAQEIAALIYVGSFFTYNFNIVVLEDIILHGNPDKVCFTKYNVSREGRTIAINPATFIEGATEFTYASPLDQVSNNLYPNLFTSGLNFIVAGASCFLGYSETAGAQKVFKPSQTNVIIRDNSLIITPATLDNNGTGYLWAHNNSEIQVNLNAFTATIPGSYFC